MGRGVKLIVSDFAISFTWVWASVMVKMLIYKPLGITGNDAKHEVVKSSMSVFNMFVFAWFGKLTNGGAYNPLMVLSTAVSADFATFLFTLAARIPAQVIGSITGVKLVLETFPEMGHATSLNVDIHKGAVTEGILTFVIVIISLGLTAKIPGSFLMKTWISSVSKVALHILGSDLTGGYMNPASVIGWAYARGDHITKEHFLVYWLAPIQATLLAVLVFRLLVQPLKEEEARLKAKKSN